MENRRQMSKGWRWALILLVVGLFVSACNAANQPLETDHEEEPERESGVDLQISEMHPLRIVSLSPSQTETLFALGLEEKIIGVSDYCDYPAAALEKEPLGSSWTINLERIIELEPDLVFTFAGGQPEAVNQMTAMGITVVDMTPESVEAVFESILETGRLTGAEATATTLVDQLTTEMDMIVGKVSELPRVPVFYQVWDEPLQTAGPGSFIHELIQLAGGENIAGDAEGAYPMYSVEALVEKNPAIYFMPPHVADFDSMTEAAAEAYRDEVRRRPGYDQIAAIQNDRIELMEPNIASRPGARIVEALRLFAEAIHPEVF
ncbi:ABC transporter substrate-binding protein [Anoxynatronum buryatiense]|uniref:Iron complex transport system substrate-binding protein n=1 Tax=Anoxynatronum buryatiense TaxID=489973 RepID=A0AA45WT13_9CLOT|nr:ABC transporter substrate-binding protein [Anoxynatronum buryatiense]SMP39069.1 iron complex transport system substrate-binding protein [Anoxynatronum buryatiense]